MRTGPSNEIVILGGSFAGLTAAYHLEGELGDRHHITVIDKNDRFIFIPSLIWVPFGWWTPEQISFPRRSPLERNLDAGNQGIHVHRSRLCAPVAEMASTGPRPVGALDEGSV